MLVQQLSICSVCMYEFCDLICLTVCSGINNVRQMDIFRILSGILHMGNVIIEKDERAIDKCHIAVSNSKHVSKLLFSLDCVSRH